jgi:hypothetical protein
VCPGPKGHIGTGPKGHIGTGPKGHIGTDPKGHIGGTVHRSGTVHRGGPIQLTDHERTATQRRVQSSPRRVGPHVQSVQSGGRVHRAEGAYCSDQ